MFKDIGDSLHRLDNIRDWLQAVRNNRFPVNLSGIAICLEKGEVDRLRTLQKTEGNATATKSNLAMSLNNLSVRLGESGGRAGGLEVIKEAVAIRRQLAKDNFGRSVIGKSP